jgi:hypothetical protein
MSLPSCNQLASYSAYLGSHYAWDNEDEKDPCEGCEGANLSDCCSASIMFSDLCSSCRDHCGSCCDDCEDKKEYDKRNK